MNLNAIKIGKNPPEDINCIIEVPIGGEPIKYEMDKEAGTLVVDRFLYTPMRYPGNYGFVPHTLSDDGDPIDVLVAIACLGNECTLERLAIALDSDPESLRDRLVPALEPGILLQCAPIESFQLRPVTPDKLVNEVARQTRQERSIVLIAKTYQKILFKPSSTATEFNVGVHKAPALCDSYQFPLPVPDHKTMPIHSIFLSMLALEQIDFVCDC